ncbi:MAG: hypothetical protein ACOC1F_04810 [Myxococcota bacterium]
MRLAHLIGPKIRDLLHDDPEQVGQLLEEVHPEDLADDAAAADQAPGSILPPARRPSSPASWTCSASSSTSGSRRSSWRSS